jgi:hypothetical protein
MMMTSAWVWAACATLASCASCQGGQQPEATSKSQPVTTKAAPPANTASLQAKAVRPSKAEVFPACPGARAFSLDLAGWSQERVSDRYGPPAERVSYKAGDRGGEFYAGLENLYPSKVPGNRDIPIEEWSWESGDCILTAWFHRVNGVWTSFDDVYRNKDVAF